MSYRKKSQPAFQLYASDLMADRRYRLMTLEERGLLLSLLCECWVNQYLPDSQDELSRLLGVDVKAVGRALTEAVLSFFQRGKSGLYCPGLEEYRLAARNRLRMR